MYATPGTSGRSGFDMQRSPTIEENAAACQAKCQSVSGCAYFNFFHGKSKCHLQDSSAELRDFTPYGAYSTLEYGPRVCSDCGGCNCTVTLYQHYAEGYPKDEHGNQVEGNSANCGGEAHVNGSICSTGDMETFTEVGPPLNVVGTNGSTRQLMGHVSGAKVTGDSTCQVHAYNKVNCTDTSQMGIALTPSTQVEDTSSRSYEPGVVPSAATLGPTLQWTNDATKCIRMSCAATPPPTPQTAP